MSKKVILNLNFPIIDESGEQVMNETNLAKVLGSSLIKSVSTEEADILKYFGWASELGKSGKLELDVSDSKKLRKFIIENVDIFVIVKAPMLGYIDKLKFD